MTTITVCMMNNHIFIFCLEYKVKDEIIELYKYAKGGFVNDICHYFLNFYSKYIINSLNYSNINLLNS